MPFPDASPALTPNLLAFNDRDLSRYLGRQTGNNSEKRERE
jgi:hypothetical protein